MPPEPLPAFNAHHAPVGAYATFTLGVEGRGGGLALESGHPPAQDVFVGVEHEDGTSEALPFFAPQAGNGLRAVPLDAVTRTFGATVDTFAANDLELRILSPLRPVPEPGVASRDELCDGLLPAVLAELTVDNRGRTAPRRAFFGVGSGEHALTIRAAGDRLVADRGEGRLTAVAAPGATAASGPDLATILGGHGTGAGAAGALLFDVPADARVTHRIVLAFWHAGVVASGPGIACSFAAARLFDGLDGVIAHALEHFDRLAAEHADAGAEIDAAPLSDDQRFQLAHAIRSYYGNTALLERDDGRPEWLVLEGEYEFVTTLDLTVDQAFFELRQSPWTVRNQLDLYLERGTTEDEHGLRFVHDLGTFPAFSAPGRSSYEHRLHMTGEELANWALTALLYVAQTGDLEWAAQRTGALAACLDSLVAREDRDDEITTYDGLDPSLKQARGSTYLASKRWGAYVCLAAFFAARGDAERAEAARGAAATTAATLLGAADAGGRVPALLGGEVDAVTVPVVEGLVYPLFAGGEADAALADLLGRHLRAVLAPGACRTPDGGWALTTTDDAVWLSKIYLAQFLARSRLGIAWDEDGARADAAHVAWLTRPPVDRFAWTDQIATGIIRGSRYYPRGVTAALWLEEHPSTARLHRYDDAGKGG